MGAGSFAASVGPAGFDPPGDPSARAIATAGRMPQIDITTRRVLLDANGNVVAIHPVDHTVSVLLGFARNSLASTPGMGLDVARVRTVRRSNAADVIEDMVRVALAAPLKALDIRLESVVTNYANGRTSFEVTYSNLRLPSSRPRTLTIAIPPAAKGLT